MTQPFIPIPIDWNRHPIYRKLRREDPTYPERLMHLVFTTAQSREPGKLIVSDGTPLGVEDLADDHDGDMEAWGKFMAFGESIDIFAKDDDAWTVTIWRLFSRDPVAEEKDRSRKQRDRDKERHEKELAAKQREIELVRSQLQQISESSPDNTQENPEPSESVQECPSASKDVRERPEPSESVQKTPPIDIDQDIDLHEDLRSNTTACAETALEPRTPDRTRGTPATWSASLFKNACPPEKVVEQTERYYAKLAQWCQLSPKALTGKMQLELLRRLEAGAWSDQEPIVQLVAIAIGANIAYDIYSAGLIAPGAIWPMALKHGELHLSAAKEIADLNRNAVDLGEPTISTKAAMARLPTTLEKQELAGVNSS